MYNLSAKNINSEKLLGKMIVLDGIDGAGKSTHMSWIVDWLRQNIRKRTLLINDSEILEVVMTREPGGTVIGETLREIVLHQEMTSEVESLLIFAARQQHLRELIFPALKRGAWIVCDRFTDSTFAYQGFGKRVNMDFLRFLEFHVQGDWYPDLTILFDLPVELAMNRRMKRESSNQDRFEDQNQVFYERVRQGYLDRALKFPGRYIVVNAMQSIPQIQYQISCALKRFLCFSFFD